MSYQLDFVVISPFLWSSFQPSTLPSTMSISRLMPFLLDIWPKYYRIFEYVVLFEVLAKSINTSSVICCYGICCRVLCYYCEAQCFYIVFFILIVFPFLILWSLAIATWVICILHLISRLQPYPKPYPKNAKLFFTSKCSINFGFGWFSFFLYIQPLFVFSMV